MKVLLLRSLRISTTWSRKQLLSASTLRGTGKTRTPSSGWFLSRAESTVLLVTTRRPRSSLPSGNSKYTLKFDSLKLFDDYQLLWILILIFLLFQRVYHSKHSCGLRNHRAGQSLSWTSISFALQLKSSMTIDFVSVFDSFDDFEFNENSRWCLVVSFILTSYKLGQESTIGLACVELFWAYRSPISINYT